MRSYRFQRVLTDAAGQYFFRALPVADGSPERQDLAHAMQSADRAAADVEIRLQWFDPSSSAGGREPDTLATGALNLRALWEGGREMGSAPVQLVDDYQEVTTVTVTTTLLRALERVMPPSRR